MFPIQYNPALVASTSAPRPLKRQRDEPLEPAYELPILPARPLKRSKSENVTPLRRYLIGCASVIFTKNDVRARDAAGKPVSTRAANGKKGYAPSSDLAQKEMVEIYFDNVDRTVVSQSKGNGHEFAPPSWDLMESYLFPWMKYNNPLHNMNLTRVHIKHVAFRLTEYLATKGLIKIKYTPEETESDPTLKNVAMGDVRGWWWEADGDFPPRFESWLDRRASSPNNYREVMAEVLVKPWPARLSTLGLVIDPMTPMPPVPSYNHPNYTMQTLLHTARPTNKRSLSDVDMMRNRFGRVAAGPTRPVMRRSTTQVDLRGMQPIQPGVPHFTFSPAAPEPADPRSSDSMFTYTYNMPEDVGSHFGIRHGTITTCVPVWTPVGPSNATPAVNESRGLPSANIFGTATSNWEATTQTGWDAPNTSSFGSQPAWSPLENTTTGVESYYDSYATPFASTAIASNPDADFVAGPLTSNEVEIQWSGPSTLLVPLFPEGPIEPQTTQTTNEESNVGFDIPTEQQDSPARASTSSSIDPRLLINDLPVNFDVSGALLENAVEHTPTSNETERVNPLQLLDNTTTAPTVDRSLIARAMRDEVFDEYLFDPRLLRDGF